MENFRLKVFRTVAEQASFRKASERLNLSQPAVSQQVHALEEELGVTLFDRSGNRVRLTPAGTVLLKYARRGAQLAREAVEALAKIEGEPRGELRLGASTTVAQYILPRILGAFQKQYPQVALSVTSGNTEHIVEVLLRGGIEMGIIEGPGIEPGAAQAAVSRGPDGADCAEGAPVGGDARDSPRSVEGGAAVDA